MRSQPALASAFAAFLLLAACVSRAGAAEPAAPLEGELEAIRARHHLPAIVEGGKVTELAAVGVRRLGAATAVRKDDRWHLGSCTKAMAATLLGVLAEEKKLRSETPLAEAFPKLAARMHASWRQVTLEQLLQHQGGAPHWLEAYGDLSPRLRAS